MHKKRVELLAPAGNMEGFYGAIHAGADAVYLGGSRFSARAYAENFTTEELLFCIRYAHLWGRKVYLTVNTLMKEDEFQEISGYLNPLYRAGLDGVIVQDIGVFSYIRDHYPEMELHVSTQMTLTGVHGAKLLQDMGACRIVPARELNLTEIRQIKEQTGIAIEAFIHGAMCYCYSGQCLFSSILGGRSGNRGRCAQPCRLPYRVHSSGFKSEECYPLSLKDMCTIEHIPELIQAGIDSFKIEGRMKKPEYAAGVTAIYRKYIDNYYETKNGSLKIDPGDLKKLSGLYIRSERQNGYYHKQNGRDMVTLSGPAYSGSDEELLSSIRKTFLEKKPKRPIIIYGNFVTGQKAAVTLQCEDLSVTVEGDTVEHAANLPIREENVKKQLGKLGNSIFQPDNMMITVSADAFYPLQAINELRRKAVAELEDAVISHNSFVLSREEAIPDAERHGAMMPAPGKETYHDTGKSMRQKNRIFVSVRRMEQLHAISKLLCCDRQDSCSNGTKKNSSIDTVRQIRRIYLDSGLFLSEDAGQALAECSILSKQCELVISLPYIIRERDYHLLDEKIFRILQEKETMFSGIQVRSLEGMGLLRDKNYPGKIFTDAGFYIWNRETLQVWEQYGFSGCLSGICLPLELKGTEQRALLDPEISFEKIVYGRAPMMVTANCVVNTTKGCAKNFGKQTVYLEDRYRKSFPVELNCAQCLNIIYNSVPLSLHGELNRWGSLTDLRLDFTVETAQETEAVITYFTEKCGISSSGPAPKPPYGEYTTGHEKRGVE